MAMFNVSKRGMFVLLSVLYLAALTVLAGYAMYEANYYSLPMAQTLPAFTVALPPLAGILYESIIAFQHKLVPKGALQASTAFQAVTAVLLVYEVVLATLDGAHISPMSGLACPLQNQWLDMFGRKEAHSIKRIQNAFDCCGFNTPKDKAWPFASITVPPTTCMERFERDKSCYQSWMGMEQRVAGMLLAVPIGVFIWKLIIILAPNLNTSWLPSVIRLPVETSNTRGRGPRQAIEYRDAEEQTDNDSVTAEIDQLNEDANLASHVESGRVHASSLIHQQESEAWRRL